MPMINLYSHSLFQTFLPHSANTHEQQQHGRNRIHQMEEKHSSVTTTIMLHSSMASILEVASVDFRPSLMLNQIGKTMQEERIVAS